MKRSTVILVVFMSATTLAVGQNQIKVIYDPRPDADMPSEARFDGTKPDSGSKPNSTSNLTFRIVTDLKDYCPLRNIMSNDISAISVRYYDTSFADIQEVQTYLTSVLRSGKGSTNAFCPWSEMLPVPAVEATVQFTSGRKGKWLLWRYGRSVLQRRGHEMVVHIWLVRSKTSLIICSKKSSGEHKPQVFFQIKQKMAIFRCEDDSLLS